MYTQKRIGSTYAFMCSRRSSIITDGSEPCPGGHFCIRTLDVNKAGWEGVKQQIAHRESFAQMLRDQVHTGAKEGLVTYLASTKGVLKQKEEDLGNLAKRVGMTTDNIVAQTLIHQMESGSEEVAKLRAQAEAAEKELAEYRVDDEMVEETLAYIYNWAEGEKQDRDYDALPLEVKRLTVERSGIQVFVYPVGWKENGQEMPRTVILFKPKSPTSNLG